MGTLKHWYSWLTDAEYRIIYNFLSQLPGPHEGRVWPVGSICVAFELAMEWAKVEDFHFHDLRHTFASRYVMRGGSLPALQQILGHATLAMTMRYSHLSPKHLRDEMARNEHAEQRTVAADFQAFAAILTEKEG